MTKQHKAQILTVAILTTALLFGAARKAGWKLSSLAPARAVAEAPVPQDTVYAMLNAARTGDVQAYLANYTGNMEVTLRHTLAESNERDFSNSLREANAELKGVAVSDPQITGATAAVRVEYVYQDRNEAQTMYLVEGSSGWKIARADSDERIPTLVPYGSKVK